MKRTIVNILILISLRVSSQEISAINSVLHIPDSLTYEKEIRIYRGFGTFAGTDVFRMFQLDTVTWEIEFYQYSILKGASNKTEINKRELKSVTKAEIVWAKILRTHILDLPDMSAIRYKMKKRGEIVYISGEYQSLDEMKVIMDGIKYVVIVRKSNKSNKVFYDNIDNYLKYYPEIDELAYFSELLNLIRTEFNILKE